MTNSETLFLFYKSSLTCLILQSMFAWFFWGDYTALYIYIFTFFISFTYIYSNYKNFILTKKKAVSIFLIILIQLYVVRELHIPSLILAAVRICILSIVLLLNDEYKIKLFTFFTKTLALLLVTSLFWWMLYIIGIALPHKIIDNSLGAYNNYFLFLIFSDPTLYSLIPRFSSVFLEPGYLGIITTFLIIANRFDINKIEVKIFFVAAVLSFSLAAYLVLIISLILYFVFISKKPILYLILFLLFFAVLYSLSLNLNGAENAIYKYIFMRLEYNDGQISGNNRFSPDLEFYFQNLMKSNYKYFGIGPMEYSKLTWDGGNAGYKVFIIQYGLFGTLLLIIFYLSIGSIHNKKILLLFFAYVLMFIQASYALTEFEILIYLTAFPALQFSRNTFINKSSTNLNA
jgi:hypothetical protein